MDDREHPALQRRRLQRALRGLRTAADLTQEEVAEKLYWSKSKVLRIENGQSSISVTDLQAMLRLYDLNDQNEVATLIRLARYAKRPSPMNKYKDVLSESFRRYLDHEAAAATILQFETGVIPGLLQTEAYARVTIRMLDAAATDETLSRRVEARLERKRSLLVHEVDHHWNLRIVLDESILWRPIGVRSGSPNLFRDQLRQLDALNRRNDISIRVLPFDTGEHPGMSTGSFTILGFDSPEDDDVLYQENPTGGDVIERPASDLPRYHEVFEQLRNLSLSSADSAELIADRIAALEAQDRTPKARPPPAD